MNRVVLALLCACLFAAVKADDAPCYLNIGIPYPSEEAVTVPIGEAEIACTAAPINCADKSTYPEGSNAEQMDALCAEPSSAIFQTALLCTGPHDPQDAQCDVDAIPLIFAAAFEGAKGADAFGDDKEACITEPITLASPFKTAQHLDLHSAGLNTMCEAAAEAKEMFCYGPKKVDCDKVAIAAASALAGVTNALGPLSDMDLLVKKFHIQNFLFWSIMGTIFTWIGFIMLLYAEIKAVLILRERDERERLVKANIVKANAAKMQTLLDDENNYFAIRPYVTILAYILFWVGMLFQFTPMCAFITMIFPFWFGVENACYLVVLAATLFFATSLFLMIMGLIWSCTRGWAALVLLVLGITTNGLVFTGLIGLSIWAFFLVGFLLLWFKFLPDYFESKGEKPEWLHDIGSFAVATSFDDVKKAGEGFAAVANKDIRAVPFAGQAIDAAADMKDQAEKKIIEAKEAAEKKVQEAKEAAEQQMKEAQSKLKPVESAPV